MTKIILREDLEKSKLESLLTYLEKSQIEAEIEIGIEKKSPPKSKIFNLSQGIWKDYDVSNLRERAWNRQK